MDNTKLPVKKALVPDARTMDSTITSKYYDVILDTLNEQIQNGELTSLLKCDVIPQIVLDVTIIETTYWMLNRDELSADIDIAVDLETKPEDGIEQVTPFKLCVSLWFDTEDHFRCESEGIFLPGNKPSRDGWMLDKYLVPIIGKEEIEHGAEFLWRKYCPEALNNSTFRTPNNLAKVLGLSIVRLPLYKKNSTQSILFFTDGEVTVVDDPAPKHGKEPKTRTIVIPANTIVLNTNAPTHDDWALCIYHECIHSIWHVMFYRLQDKHNSDDSLFEWIEVRLGKKGIPSNPIRWMEFQADRGSFALMLPESVAKPEIEKVYHAMSSDTKIDGYYNNHSGWRAEAAIKVMAEKFMLRKFRVKARMRQLGYSEAVGAMNYADDGYITPFALSSEYRFRPGDNFVINRKKMSELYRTNEEFRKAMATGDYVYVDGHVCMNDDRCLRRTSAGLRLTAWANAHVDLCCLMFPNIYVLNKQVEYEFGTMNSEAKYNKLYNQFLDQEGTMTTKERLKLQKELMEQMPVSFPDALAYIMKGRIKEEDLAEKSYLSVSTIARLRAEEKLNYNLDQIVAICVAMHLPPWLSEALLDRAHLDIKRYGPFGYYREILDCYFMDDIDTVQAFLINNGLKPLAL